MDVYLLPLMWMGLGLAVLMLGGDLLVRGASALAILIGVTPLVIGLTVVAFGTSAPELAVTVGACFAGETDLAIGNVVGSSIFNVLCILGVAALVRPLAIDAQLIRLDVPLMIASSVLLLAMGWDGSISRVDGGILFAMLLGYVGWSVYQGRRESARVRQELEQHALETLPRHRSNAALQGALILAGLGLLALGSHWLVGASVTLAESLGVSELLIGLTIVAVGTSLPEAAASVMAAARGQREIAVGNAVGSNIFNVLAVLGISALIAPGGIAVSEAALRFDIPVMIVVCMLCLPIFFTGGAITRREGALFVGYYLAYTTYLVLVAIQSGYARLFGQSMLLVVFPLTLIGVLIGVFKALWRSRGTAASGSKSSSQDES
ncbi:MAG: calcium/sodium antiporter [Rhodopirellula sp.]|nr:calcium/sodium antiporter [Rhodopirellula sp.]